jgi:hypothetical protein
MIKKRRWVFLLGCMLCGMAFPQDYVFTTPIHTFLLPTELREISDITVLDHSTIACIQDEKGLLFHYNVKKDEIVSRDSFYLDGDYEGIAKAGDNMYVLRSDGVIVEIKNGRAIQIYTTGVPAANNEGLCYDEKNHRLLIASKSRSTNGQYSKDQRIIYGFDLKEKKILPEPVLEINIPEIKKYISEAYGRNDSSVFSIKIKPSAIAIHPVNGKLYMLTATGYLLCIFNNGIFESAERLDPVLFNKAEGISFFKNGDMIISNEGQAGPATLLLFRYGK